MKLTFGSDHAGFEFKRYLITRLIKAGYDITDVGAYSLESVDYPDFAHKVAEAVAMNKTDFGILLCGSGNGVCITANKHKNVRAALCWTPELGALARQHNNANILCLPARFISKRMASKIVDAFLTAQFEGGRHQKRVDKINC
ncbi:MAG: ribose 5-phosphate isomerase B [Saprospiraceae bacterium]|nr:MAG: ribose 5-phosphate isomerase B [Bacteroidetes bacterium OLB9]MCO6464678.1 ribose 5-phosphate isomerase B [Saprospiraceae bacterium]MCZ2339307.1 ribose 5-phosphate isomerase B [Chitinophagales bacterium]